MIDLKHLMASPKLRGCFIERFIALLPAADVGEMASGFTQAMLSTATIIAPRSKRCQGSRGCCSREEMKADLFAEWQ